MIKKDIKEQLTIALKNSKQLLKLINQLLDFSRMESGAETVVCERKDFNAFIATVLDSFAFAFVPGITFTFFRRICGGKMSCSCRKSRWDNEREDT